MNNTFSKKLILGCTFVALIHPMSVMAQNGPPPSLPVAEIASQLNVSEALLKSCMPEPAKGARPERPNPAAIATCLQTENASITPEIVGQTLETFQPERPAPSN